MVDSFADGTAEPTPPGPSSCGHVPGAAVVGLRGASFAWPVAGLAFSLFAVAGLVFARSSPRVGTLAVTFVSVVLEAIPFVLLGSLMGGMIEVFVSRARIAALLPRGRTAAICAAACLGLLLPVCECAVIPVTRRLVRRGVPFSVAVAYLLAGPIVNPIVAASTVVAYGGQWNVVAARLLCGFVVAVVVALLVDALFPKHAALRTTALDAPSADENGPRVSAECACDADGGARSQPPSNETPAEGQSLAARLLRGLQCATDDFLNIAQFLIVGAFVAGLCQTFIPRAVFVQLASTPVAAILTMMVLAVLLNLCSEADAFVAASLRTSVPLTAQLAFLVLGPMLDLKLIAMYLSFVRRRAVLVLIIALGSLVLGLMTVLHVLGWDR